MIFLICFVAAIIGTIVYDWRKWGSLDIETFLKCILWGLIAVVIALLIWLSIVFCFSPKVDVVSSETCEITALADNARYSSVPRSVYLIQSRVDETLKYNFMYKTEGKGYGFKAVEANLSYINYTDGVPYVRIDQRDYKNSFLRWLLPDIIEAEYIFYIPENAQVIDDFVIDFD